ncbi:MAG: UDP-N-acetylmuramoyl-tripeptide--D-alanyl-D-alanine ligase [Clostridiales bacterium]
MDILSIFWIILSIPYVMYAVLGLKNQLHMLQLNSYRNDRYTLWLKTKSKFDKREIFAFLAIFPLFLNVPMGTYVSLLLWAVVYLMFIQGRDKTPAKLPLVFTQRARRLYGVAVFIYMVPAMLMVLFVLGNSAMLYWQKAICMLVLIAMSFVEPFFLMVANLILQPFEEHKKASYFLDAQKILAENPDLIKIAITGSFGKTSVKHILNIIMEEKYHTLMPPGSYNTPMGITITVREKLKPIHQAFITEMGAKQVGDIKELCELVHPQYGILTALGEQHLETFKSFENIVNTKFELIEALPDNGVAVLNFDDEFIRANANRMKGKVVSYGLNFENLDYRAKDIVYHSRGMEFMVEAPNGEWEIIKTRLLGVHNVYNIIAAIAMSQEMGLSLQQAKKAIATLAPVEHRLELKVHANGLVVIDDAFNSNPVGANAAMEVLGSMAGGKKFLITPGMVELGAKEVEENRKFGIAAAKACDYIALVGIKQTEPIKEGILSTGFSPEHLFVAENLKAANTFVYGKAVAGDIILYENDLPDTYNEK